MVKMTQTLDDGEAVVEIKYDTLGNIIEKTMPKGIDGKRMKFTYEYDKEHRMYPIRVTDAFGYRSDLFNYDYRYGIPLMVTSLILSIEYTTKDWDLLSPYCGLS